MTYPRMIGCGLLLLLGCQQLGKVEPPFSHADAIKRATQAAANSAPEVGMLEARIDGVTAELVTLEAADRQLDVRRSPDGYGPNQDKHTPVWWVRVHGFFRFESLGLPGQPAPVFTANERNFVYDARTGEELGGSMPYTQ